MSHSPNNRLIDRLAGALPLPRRLFAPSPTVSPRRRRVDIALALLAAILLPLLFQSLQDFTVLVRVFALIAIYGVMALDLNLVVGYAGMLDFGRIAFFAIGAYTAMLVGIPIAKLLGTQWGGISYLIALPISGIVAAFVGLILSLPMLRLRGDYLTIVTLGFAEIVRISITNDIGGITNGSNGLPGTGQVVPKPVGLEWLQDASYYASGDFVFQVDSNLYWYFVALLVLIIAIVVIRFQDNSRLGRSWAAMREDDIAAAAMGININAAKQYAFALGGFWGGVAGCLFAYYQAFISPESFTFMESIFVLSIVVIGGMGSIPGVIIGAVIIQGLPEFIRWFMGSSLLASAGVTVSESVVASVQNYRNIMLAIVMIVMMAYRPQGILPPKAFIRKLKGVIAPDPDAAPPPAEPPSPPANAGGTPT